MDAPAALARRALSRPAAARLVVDGEDPNGPLATGVELVDRHGVPLLLCDPGSPLHRAALDDRSAVLTLIGSGVVDGLAAAPTVLLSGRLAAAGVDRVEDREVVLVELALGSVTLTATDADPVGIAVADFLEASGPALAEYADLVRDHLNEAHDAELTAYAAQLSGTAPGDIAGTRVAALDHAGLRLRWVDLDGSYEVRVVFPEPAGCPGHLADLLRATLGTHC